MCQVGCLCQSNLTHCRFQFESALSFSSAVDDCSWCLEDVTEGTDVELYEKFFETLKEAVEAHCEHFLLVLCAYVKSSGADEYAAPTDLPDVMEFCPEFHHAEKMVSHFLGVDPQVVTMLTGWGFSLGSVPKEKKAFFRPRGLYSLFGCAHLSDLVCRWSHFY